MAVVLDTASVRVEADSRAGERDARRAGERYGREFASGADSRIRSGSPVELPVAIRSVADDFARQAREQVNRVVATLNAKIPLTAQGDRLRGQVATQVAAIEATLRARIPVDPEGVAEFRRKLAAQVDNATRTVRAHVKVDYDDGVLRGLGTRLGNILGVGSRLGGVFGAAAGSVAELGGSAARSTGLLASM
ncbi:MAG: hypothetical protein ACREX8_04645, partial [Gammaproteobacteria bacterium]